MLDGVEEEERRKKKRKKEDEQNEIFIFCFLNFAKG